MIPALNPAQLRTTLDLSGSGVMLFECRRTESGRIQGFRLILANQRAEEIFGQSEQAMLNRPTRSLFPRTLRSGILAWARQVVESGERYETELSYQPPHQTTSHWFKLTLQRYGDGVAASFTDITALKCQTMLVESVLQGSLNGIIAYEAMRDSNGRLYDFRVQLANDAAARITNTSLDRMIGSTMVAQRSDAQTSELFARYVHTIETGSPQRFQNKYPEDGVNGWFDISVSKLGDGMLITLVDISTSKQQEMELQKSIDDLQRSNQNLERFAYVASHDLQEPLRKIQSFGEILNKHLGGSLDDYGRNVIERMQSAARRMNRLILDLLTFSRLSSQKQPFQRVDLQEVLDEVMADLETVIHDKKAEISLTALPNVWGDPMQLRQVLQNLLSNALKFTKIPLPSESMDVPHVWVECQRLTGQEITPLPGQTVAPSDLNQPFFAIRVKDDGIGFDEKYLDRIFTVFQRLHTRQEYQGTGIGLAIVQKVMEHHKGYVGAHSRPGEGSTFTIYLPDVSPSVAIEGLPV